MAVTVDTIAVALGRTALAVDPAESEQWQLWISDARMLIQLRLGDLTALNQAALDYVVREAVVAHVRNPDSATQVTTSIDDASTSRQYRTSYGRVRILDEWWPLLAPNDNPRRVYEIDMMPSPTVLRGGYPLPWFDADQAGI